MTHSPCCLTFGGLHSSHFFLSLHSEQSSGQGTQSPFFLKYPSLHLSTQSPVIGSLTFPLSHSSHSSTSEHLLQWFFLQSSHFPSTNVCPFSHSFTLHSPFINWRGSLQVIHSPLSLQVLQFLHSSHSPSSLYCPSGHSKTHLPSTIFFGEIHSIHFPEELHFLQSSSSHFLHLPSSS